MTYIILISNPASFDRLISIMSEDPSTSVDAVWRVLACASVLGAVYIPVLVSRLRERHQNRVSTFSKAEIYRKLLHDSIHQVQIPHIDSGVRQRVLVSSIQELHNAIVARELSCVQIVSVFITQIQSRGVSLCAVLDERLRLAIEEAETLDANLASGATPGDLYGIPFSVKDMICVTDCTSSFGIARLCYNKMTADSNIIQVLRRRGAIPLVKSSMPQLGMTSETVNYVCGACRNPWAETRSAGGSSGGEAALVSSRSVVFGLGGDIGGSIRIPCSYTGLVGLRPTSNRVSSAGPSAKSGYPGIFTSWGPIGRTVQDVSMVMSVLCSDEVHSTDPLIPHIPWTVPSHKSLKIGYASNDAFAVPVPSAVRAVEETVNILRGKGHEVVEFTVPDLRESYDLFIAMMLANTGTMGNTFQYEAPLPAYKSTYLTSRLPPVFRRLLSWYYSKYRNNPVLANRISSMNTSYSDLVNRVKTYQRKFASAWKAANIDVLIAPFPLLACPHGSDIDESPLFIWTLLFNFVDFPAGTVPVTTVRADECTYSGTDPTDSSRLSKVLANAQGLPISVQVVSKPFQDELCLAVMQEIETGRAFETPTEVYRT